MRGVAAIFALCCCLYLGLVTSGVTKPLPVGWKWQNGVPVKTAALTTTKPTTTPKPTTTTTKVTTTTTPMTTTTTPTLDGWKWVQGARVAMGPRELGWSWRED